MKTKIEYIVEKVLTDNGILHSRCNNTEGNEIRINDLIGLIKYEYEQHYRPRTTPTYKIKITKCSYLNLWYSKQIGSILLAKKTKKYFPGFEFKVIGAGYVRSDDCEIIETL